ncbi:MAG: DUF3644 domain-containing protein [Eubacteriales bacterium]|nr:DUF3644 domain-containing protein [Eubacteriales bacterium]
MESSKTALANNLVSKSIEAFIMGLEIYNKPTIRYRTEGFSFFICNAWELMLKAHLIKRDGEQSIYYENDLTRTISLKETIARIYTDIRQPLRINLEQIIEFRNINTHFITDDYESIYAPLFQACTLNFCEQIKRFHGVDITSYVAQNFLTITTSIDLLNPEEIRGKYTDSMAQRLIDSKAEVELLTKDNPSQAFSIPIKHIFYKTKDRAEADFSYTFSKDASEKAKEIKIIQKAEDKYTLSFKNVIDAVNKNLIAKNIKFNYVSSKGKTGFNSYTLNLMLDFFALKTDERYCTYVKFVGMYRYTPQVVEFVVKKVEEEPNVIEKIHKEKITPGS